MFISILLTVLISSGPIAGIDSSSDYLVYYGSWNDEKVFRAKDFDLVILEPSRISAEQVQEIRAGHDGILGTNDDVIVVGYISIGEDHVGNHTGNGKGPCYFDWRGDSIIFENRGVASWYVDDRDTNGIPDRNGTWGSYYVNAGDTLWWQFIDEEADAIFVKGCDGLFLDTIDTASPCSWGVPYCWTKEGMSSLVAHLRERYPDKILIANRGLFFFDPNLPDYYSITIRPYINGVMFEDYYLEWDWSSSTAHVSPWFGQNRTYWAPRVNNEARKPDGFTVFALDYLNPRQVDYQTLLNNQITYTIIDQGWVDYISHIYLDVIRYDVFHHHPDGDRNPPTWDTTIGLQMARAENTSVTLYWNNASDQTPPVRYNIYYLDRPFSSPSEANLIPRVNPIPGSVTTWKYTVNGLDPNKTYYFLVRAEDSANPPHEDYNMIIKNTQTGNRRIIIDGNFEDWNGIQKLDSVPQPDELQGDSPNPNADIVDLWCINLGDTLYFSYSVLGSFHLDNFFYHVFLDTDHDSSTGYPMGSIGADYMVENGSLYRYAGSGGWSWAPIYGLDIVYASNRVEMSMPVDTINLQFPLHLIVNVNDASPPYNSLDFAPDDWSSTYYYYPVSMRVPEKISPAYVSFDPKLRILDMNVKEPSNYSIYLADVSGRIVDKIFSGFLQMGSHRFVLPQTLNSGIYFLLIENYGVIKTFKLMII